RAGRITCFPPGAEFDNRCLLHRKELVVCSTLHIRDSRITIRSDGTITQRYGRVKVYIRRIWVGYCQRTSPEVVTFLTETNRCQFQLTKNVGSTHPECSGEDGTWTNSSYNF